jgi:hypothetical protein
MRFFAKAETFLLWQVALVKNKQCSSKAAHIPKHETKFGAISELRWLAALQGWLHSK